MPPESEPAGTQSTNAGLQVHDKNKLNYFFLENFLIWSSKCELFLLYSVYFFLSQGSVDVLKAFSILLDGCVDICIE